MQQTNQESAADSEAQAAQRGGLLQQPHKLAEIAKRKESTQRRLVAEYQAQTARQEEFAALCETAGIADWHADPPYPEADETGRRPTEVPLNSLEGSVGYSSLLRAMFEAGRRRIAFYRSPAGGNLAPEEAWATVYRECDDKELAQIALAEIQTLPFDLITLADFIPLATVAPRLAEVVWERLKGEAQAEFESGHLATRAVTSVPHRRDAWEVACFMGLRESFAQQWGVNGGIDGALIDMLAQAYYMVQFWTKEADKRMQERPRQETYEYTQWRQQRKIEAGQWDNGWWDIPYVSEQAAIDHATAQVEKWNRIFLRTLRNLRDLRRYAPVTINNPQQVNIATDGGQQVNVQPK